MSETRSFRGRIIKAGHAEGFALVSPAPIGFLGGVDPDRGVVIEPGHPLKGQSVAGRILVFPTGKGSTVGSYTIYRLKRNGVAPAGMICAESEPIVAVGAIISEIPMLDLIPIEEINDGDQIIIQNDTIVLQRGHDHAGS